MALFQRKRWKEPMFSPYSPGPRKTSSYVEHPHQLQCLVKCMHDALLVSKETKPAECSLQTFRDLLLCLACASNGEETVRFDTKELQALKQAGSRVVVLWLSSVPWPLQVEDGKSKTGLESLSTCNPCIELGIQCPISTTDADVFLSSAFINSKKNGKRRSAPTVSELVFSSTELVQQAYPVPSQGNPASEHGKTIEPGKFVYSFKWEDKEFVTFHKNFKTCPKASDSAPMYAIDCEMVRTSEDPRALARVSMVDQRGQCVYDTFVKPPDTVLDYLTRYSGITADMLQNETTTLSDVQDRLFQIIPDDAILVGQSLENDLRALGFAHPYVIDTSVIFVPEGCFSTPSLAQLAKAILNKDMQRGSNGHNSVVDARTALELVQAKASASNCLMLEPERVREDTFFDVLSDLKISSVMIDSALFVKKYAHPLTVTCKSENDQRALWCMDRLSQARFGWLQLHSYESLFRTDHSSFAYPGEKKLKQMDSAVKFFLSSLPSGTSCAIVFGGSARSDNDNLLRCHFFLKP